ncbi:MAG: lasso peptide biosynthesis B2 protein, partial [Acidobacteria bacterium]
HNVESQMRIGVTKDDGQFKAHAWVELLGSALNDRQDVSRRFKPFDHAIDPSRLQLR